jgi:hypothetical protein
VGAQNSLPLAAIGEQHTVSIAPNPVRGNELILSIQSDDHIRIQVQIIDSRGNRMQSITIRLAPGSNQIRLNVSGLGKGFYSALVLYPSGRRAIIKFLKL